MCAPLRAVCCAGALQDSLTLREHAQAPALLAQLKQPFSAAAGSSATKVRPTQRPQITICSLDGLERLVQSLW